MEPNLFYSLFKYSATRDREPLEDYFTELVGFLFNLDKELASEWIRKISEGALNPNPDNLKVFTQYSLGTYGRADLVLHWDENDEKKSLIVEHKIDSPIGERGLNETGQVITQVRKYLDFQKARGSPEDHKVAICKVSPLTSYHPISRYFLGEFTWGRFHTFLEDFIKIEPKSAGRIETNFLCEQISQFMRRCGMAYENLSVQDLASISQYHKFEQKLYKLMEIIQAEFSKPSENLKSIVGDSKIAWGEGALDKHGGLIIHNRQDCSKASIWIHVGTSMYIEEKYYPPIIIKEQKIPDIQVMLALWPDREDLTKVKDTYGNICERLNQYLKEIPGTDASFEMIPSDRGFLCFHFRKPLSDFLKYQEQESEVIKFLKAGFEAISNLETEGILSRLSKDDCLK